MLINRVRSTRYPGHFRCIVTHSFTFPVSTEVQTPAFGSIVDLAHEISRQNVRIFMIYW